MVQSLSGDKDKPDSEIEPDAQWEEVQRQMRARAIDETASNSPPSVESFPAAVHSNPANLAAVVRAMQRDGAVILQNAVSEQTCDNIIEQIQPYLDDTDTGDGFLGSQTKRASAVVARAPASWACIQHPMLMKLCEGVLGRQVLGMTKAQMQARLTPGNAALPWQLSLSQVICIGGENRAQALHQDGWGFVLDMKTPAASPASSPGSGGGEEAAAQAAAEAAEAAAAADLGLSGHMQNEISTIWALSDFREENGATQVVPGSHLWPASHDVRAGRMPDRDKAKGEVARAVMPRGSVLVYLGSTWHGGGGNTTASEARYGLNIDYNLALLRQEENQFLAAPPAVARHFPTSLQRLVGYTMPGTSFGYYAEYLHPRNALEAAAAQGATAPHINAHTAHLLLKQAQERQGAQTSTKARL